MARYIALAHRSDSGGWGVSFPDFPGCIAAEKSFDATIDAAAQALRFHVEGMIEDGDKIPAPRSIEELQVDPEFADDLDEAVITLVPLLPPRAKPVRINISLDANLVAQLDELAAKAGMNRSEFLAEGARRVVTNPTRWQILERSEQKALAEKAISEVLKRIAGEGREPDDWEREHLSTGLDAILRGWYALAHQSAQLALTPRNHRNEAGLERYHEELQRFTLDRLQRQLRRLEGAPVIPRGLNE